MAKSTPNSSSRLRNRPGTMAVARSTVFFDGAMKNGGR